MGYSWDDIKASIESVETKRALDTIHAQTYKDQNGKLGLKREHLVLLGGICAGISAGIITCIFNYLFFVWLLHMEF